MLFKNRNIQFLIVVMGCIIGVFNALGTIVGISAGNVRYTSAGTSLLGGLFILGGVLGGLVFGVLL